MTRTTYRGEDNHRSTLTWEKVREIRRLRAEKVPVKVVAQQFGISTGHVCNIDANRMWRE